MLDEKDCWPVGEFGREPGSRFSVPSLLPNARGGAGAVKRDLDFAISLDGDAGLPKMLPDSCFFGEPKSPVASDEPLDSGFFDEPKSPALSKGPLGSSFDVAPKSPGPLSLKPPVSCFPTEPKRLELSEKALVPSFPDEPKSPEPSPDFCAPDDPKTPTPSDLTSVDGCPKTGAPKAGTVDVLVVVGALNKDVEENSDPGAVLPCCPRKEPSGAGFVEEEGVDPKGVDVAEVSCLPKVLVVLAAAPVPKPPNEG